MHAFAAGVLVGDAFLHLYPEGMAMVDIEDPIETMWKTGLSVMGGPGFVPLYRFCTC